MTVNWRVLMQNKDRRFLIGVKMYIFIAIAVFSAAFGASLVSYSLYANKIDAYYKNLSFHSAENFSAFVDGDYLKELRAVVESEEYQTLRDAAEEADDESMVVDYLKEKGLWEGYEKNRGLLVRYLRNMKDLKYLYIVVWGDADDVYDMYLLDDEEEPVYETGYYEEREPELMGKDATDFIEPTINHGDWGWLCSSYVPVYDSNGSLVCQIGCDIAMDEIMNERRIILIYVVICASAFTILVLAAAMQLVNRTVINPLKLLTEGLKKFSPSETKSYEEAGVIDLNIKSRDEIQDIYEEVQMMQKRIIDHLRDLLTVQQQKELAESEVKEKEKELGEMSRDALSDSLTGVGNKLAYTRTIEKLNNRVRAKEPGLSFAILMIDVNCLKVINDNYGHTSGDTYLRGCCHTICEVFKHSPVFRIGGDEFIAVLQGSDYDRRFEKLEELNSQFERLFNDKSIDPWFRYSASSGIADFASDDSSVELVFKRADKAMYESKQAFKKKYGLETR